MNKLVGSGHPAAETAVGYGAKSPCAFIGQIPLGRLAGRVAGCASRAALGQNLVAQTAINDRPDHLLAYKSCGKPSSIRLASSSVFNWSAESTKSKLARLSCNCDSFRAPIMGMTGTGR